MALADRQYSCATSLLDQAHLWAPLGISGDQKCLRVGMNAVHGGLQMTNQWQGRSSGYDAPNLYSKHAIRLSNSTVCWYICSFSVVSHCGQLQCQCNGLDGNIEGTDADTSEHSLSRRTELPLNLLAGFRKTYPKRHKYTSHAETLHMHVPCKTNTQVPCREMQVECITQKPAMPHAGLPWLTQIS